MILTNFCRCFHFEIVTNYHCLSFVCFVRKFDHHFNYLTPAVLWQLFQVQNIQGFFPSLAAIMPPLLLATAAHLNFSLLIPIVIATTCDSTNSAFKIKDGSTNGAIVEPVVTDASTAILVRYIENEIDIVTTRTQAMKWLIIAFVPFVTTMPILLLVLVPKVRSPVGDHFWNWKWNQH